jgi:hypothetical protein
VEPMAVPSILISVRALLAAFSDFIFFTIWRFLFVRDLNVPAPAAPTRRINGHKARTTKKDPVVAPVLLEMP